MLIAVGSDEKSHLTEAVLDDLHKRGVETELHGALHPSGMENLWPEVGRNVGERVASGSCKEGILFCWTGTGVSIAANKVPGIRAALCIDGPTAAGAKRWNHANILVISLRITSPHVAQEILDAWFSTPYGKGENAKCVALISDIEHSFSDTRGQPQESAEFTS